MFYKLALRMGMGMNVAALYVDIYRYICIHIYKHYVCIYIFIYRGSTPLHAAAMGKAGAERTGVGCDIHNIHVSYMCMYIYIYIYIHT